MELEELARFTGNQSIENPAYLLEFSDGMGTFSDNIIALEMDEELIDKLKAGNEVNLVGEGEGHVKLCTDSQTFRIKTCETSNSVVVIADQAPRSGKSDPRVHIQKAVGMVSAHLELELVRINLTNLNNVLKEYPYKGPQFEEEYTEDCILGLDALVERIGCSKGELLDLFDKSEAILIGGFWRLIDMFYLSKCIVQIVSVVDEKRWESSHIPVSGLFEALKTLCPKFILKHCIDLCCSSGETRDSVELLHPEVSRLVATYVLYPPRRMALGDFFSTLNSLLPVGVTPLPQYLVGTVIIDYEKKIVSYFPVKELSVNPHERIDQLYAFQEKWDRDKIEPYLVDLLRPGDTVDGLLSKYCRKTVDKEGRQSLLRKNSFDSCSL